MKINNSTPPETLGQVGPSTKVKPPAQPTAAEQSGHTSVGSPAQGSASVDTSQDIDMARVAEIRDAIREGRLEIRADKISEGMLNSLREMLDSE